MVCEPQKLYTVCTFSREEVHRFYHILQGSDIPQKVAVIPQKVKARAKCLMLAPLSHPKEEYTQLMQQFPTCLQVRITRSVLKTLSP